MKLSPINTPRVAPVTGHKTVSAQEARERAMNAYTAQAEAPAGQVGAAHQATAAALSTGQSPSQPGAILDPSNLGTSAPSEGDAQVNPDAASAQSSEQAAPSEATKAAESTDEARIKAHYANLARKEKMQRMREARIDAKLRELEQKASGAPATQASSASIDPSKYVSRDELLNDPFGVLNQMGLGYDKLTEKALHAPSAEEMAQRRELAQLKAELAAIKEAQTETKKSLEDNQLSARQQAEMQLHHDVKRLINVDPSYEVIKAHGAERQVVKLITDIYDKGAGAEYPKGTLLDVSEAAALVEEELVSRILKVANTQKVKSQLTRDTTAQKQPQAQQQQNNTALRTLTNNVGTSTRKLSPRDRALAAFRGEVV